MKLNKWFNFITHILLLLILFSYNNCSRPLSSLDPFNINSKQLGTDTGNPFSSVAILPKTFLVSDFPELPLNHRIFRVGADKPYQDCQGAIDEASPGDEVVIDAKFVCSPIQLNDKGSSNLFVVIRTANLDQLPSQGNRVSPSDSQNMAIIETSVDDYAVFVAERAHHYHLAGIEIRVNANFNGIHRGLISVGPWNLTPADQIPHSIVFSRSWIHGNPLQEILNGIRLNGSAVSVVDSLIEDIHAHDETATAIVGWKMGAGPFKIVNNEFIASGGALYLGGYATTEDQIPSDIEFRKNYVHQLVEWRNTVTSLAGLTGPWRTGSLISFGNAQRILVSGNIFENQWSQLDVHNYGYAVEFAPDATANPGQIFARVQDVTFINNIIRNAAGAFNIIYQNFEVPSAITQRLEISNNLIYNIGSSWGDSLGIILLRQEAQGPVVFSHNTLLNVEGAGPMLLDPWSKGLYTQFTFINNLCSDQGDGIKDSNHATGTDTLLAMFPGVVFHNNVLAGQIQSDYYGNAETNYFPANLSAINFLSSSNTALTDYHGFALTTTSPYVGKASDGTDIGASIPLIDEAMK